MAMELQKKHEEQMQKLISQQVSLQEQRKEILMEQDNEAKRLEQQLSQVNKMKEEFTGVTNKETPVKKEAEKKPEQKDKKKKIFQATTVQAKKPVPAQQPKAQPQPAKVQPQQPPKVVQATVKPAQTVEKSRNTQAAVSQILQKYHN